jgi:single-stranded-DNA-specific exonuclease
VAGLAENKHCTRRHRFHDAPRINAAGRLGQARLAVELLTTENAERAVALADYLDELNKSRRTVERRMFKQARELVAANPEWESHETLVLAHHEWHAGVIGIVANRVAEQFQKPTVMIALQPQTEVGQGSCRTFGGFDLHAALTEFARFAVVRRHQAAAGLKIESGRIEDFREEFHAAARC